METAERRSRQLVASWVLLQFDRQTSKYASSTTNYNKRHWKLRRYIIPIGRITRLWNAIVATWKQMWSPFWFVIISRWHVSNSLHKLSLLWSKMWLYAWFNCCHFLPFEDPMISSFQQPVRPPDIIQRPRQWTQCIPLMLLMNINVHAMCCEWTVSDQSWI